jgi:hypothetical protein
VPTPAELREANASLSTIAAKQLAVVWLEAQAAEQVRDALLDVLPTVVFDYATAAAAFAADWYDNLRDALGVRRRFTAIPVDLSGPLGADELARWGVGPLFSPEPDPVAARTLIEGGLQRRIANASRDTIRESAIADPAADGWQRVGDGSCGFCTMLIARGAVYSDKTANFASHDHCNCAAVPAFGGQPRPAKPYTPSSRNISDADRARVREYLRTH